MGDVLEFKRKPAFQQAAEGFSFRSSAMEVGYHEFVNLRNSNILMIYTNDSGDGANLDFLLIKRESDRRQGKDHAEMHLSNTDYIYLTLCRLNKPIQSYGGTIVPDTLTMRYDEETFTPMLREARMKYMRQNFSITPASSL